MTGVRLNLALVAFRQGKYEDAVPYLKAIVKEQPASVQPAYLLGLSYFLYSTVCAGDDDAAGVMA